jgi:hypothetical protein
LELIFIFYIMPLIDADNCDPQIFINKPLKTLLICDR